MANTTTAAHIKHMAGVGQSAPSSIVSGWRTLLPAGRLSTEDANPVVNPGALDNRVKLTRNAGTNLLLRVRYKATTAATTVGVVVFGGTDDETPAKLRTPAGVHRVTISIDPATDLVDAGDSDYRLSHPKLTDALDCMGGEWAMAAVEAALSGTDAGDAELQALFI